MDFDLSKEQKKIVDKAQWVARECLEPRAAQYDETGGHPWESWHDLWKNGLLGIAVPAEFGGLGLDMLTYIAVVEKLAQGCTNTAMTLHMHSVVQRYIDALANREQKATYYPDVVEKGKLFGSWGSEPQRRGSGGAIERETVISPADEGYVINGRKHFCTMAGAAFRYMVHCTMEGHEGADGFIMVLVPQDSRGLDIAGDWNTLGMRATVSPSVSFDDCFVTEDALLGKPGEVRKTSAGQGFGLGYAAVYLGAAQRALDFVIEYCKTQQFAPDPAPLSHSPTVQRNVAQMTMALEGARLVLYQSAGAWEESDQQGRFVLAARAKHLATEAALMVTSKAIQTVGGRSAHRRFPLERLFRDVRTSTLMPPNAERSMELIGKAELGVEDEMVSQHTKPNGD